jgi:hypothetical protein
LIIAVAKNWNIAKVNEDKTTKVVVTIPYRLKNSFKLLERNFEMEFFLLLIVVFLSAVSIFLVLLQGIFKRSGAYCKFMCELNGFF